MRIGRTAGGLVAAVLAALAALGTGCSGPIGGTAVPVPGAPGASSPAAAVSSVTGDFVKALLPTKVLPAGLKSQTYDLSTFPRDRLDQTANGLTVTPTECEQLAKAPLQNLSAGRGAVLVAVGSKGEVTSTVTPAPVDLSPVERSLELCRSATVSYGVQFTGHLAIEQITPPAVTAEKVLAYRLTTAFDLPARTAPQLAKAIASKGSSEVVVMEQRGILVTVMVTGKPGATAVGLAPRALQQALTTLQ